MKLKDKKIEILLPTYTKDGAGFSVEHLNPIAPPVWAYYRQLSGKEIYAVASTHAVEEVLFIINWRADITTRHVVRFRGVLYDITRVDDFQGYREDLGVYGKTRGK
jgi:SPP1 family predicted phage head-tail adaptor